MPLTLPFRWHCRQAIIDMPLLMITLFISLPPRRRHCCYLAAIDYFRAFATLMPWMLSPLRFFAAEGDTGAIIVITLFSLRHSADAARFTLR